MTVPDIRGEFEEFFLEAWGVRPFNWQVDLAEEVVAEGGWPDVIDLPTGAGKTSVLDIAVFTLAHHPARMQRRIAFVVDRRTIVDQTARRYVLVRQCPGGSGCLLPQPRALIFQPTLELGHFANEPPLQQMTAIQLERPLVLTVVDRALELGSVTPDSSLVDCHVAVTAIHDGRVTQLASQNVQRLTQGMTGLLLTRLGPEQRKQLVSAMETPGLCGEEIG